MITRLKARQSNVGFEDEDDHIGEHESIVLCESNKNNKKDLDHIYYNNGLITKKIKIGKRKGLCGLTNIGNTCFMNSSLQCLSNTPPLRDYFLSKQYKKDINYSNPLGMNGMLAKSFYSLLSDMWMKNYASVMPSNFKKIVGKKFSQFANFAQNDSQEFLQSLLDGLHEDLNRVNKKKYVEHDSMDGQSHHSIALESWENHLKRNQSVIVDLFQAQLKSTLVCPICLKKSIKFDPYLFLSVPVPNNKRYLSGVIVLPTKKIFNYFWMKRFLKQNQKVKSEKEKNECENKPSLEEENFFNYKRDKHFSVKGEKFVVPVTPNSTIGLFKYRFCEISNNDYNEVDFFDLDGYSIKSKLKENMRMKDIDQDILITCTVQPKISKKLFSKIFIYQRKMSNGKLESCGIPYCLCIPKSVRGDELYYVLYQTIKRYSKKRIIHEFDEKINEDPSTNSASTSTEQLKKCKKIDEIFKISCVSHDGEKCGNCECQNPNCVGCHYLNNKNNIHFEDKRCISIDWCDSEDFLQQQAMVVSLNPSCARIKKQERNMFNVEHCLSFFSETEQLSQNDTWYCPKCKDHRKAFKKMDLWNVPNILIIHLKRFSNTRSYRSKVTSFIDFPTEIQMNKYIVNDKIEQPLKYELFGTSNHSGAIGGGHYIAYVKNSITGKWYEFNDSQCFEIKDVESIKRRSTYLLFYQLIEPKKKKKKTTIIKVK